MDKLGRAGAVRERKGEVHEMNGHQFVARRFYHIMKCALCGDFMAKLTFQCEGKKNYNIYRIIFVILIFIYRLWVGVSQKVLFSSSDSMYFWCRF